MVQPALRRVLPRSVRSRLFGDRERWGFVADETDPCWQAWQKIYLDFYSGTQRAGVGRWVNEAGYRVMAGVDLSAKTVLEIGPGDIRHIDWWRAAPAEYVLVDTQPAMLTKASRILAGAGVCHSSRLVRRGEPLPANSGSIDVVVSFYSLEHIYPLEPYLLEVNRVLKPGGLLVGAIPSEGGVSWGLGRFLTSRRWIKSRTSVDPDKIICWEHPNFADQVLGALDAVFERRMVRYWPFPLLPVLDANLLIKFVYRSRG